MKKKSLLFIQITFLLFQCSAFPAQTPSTSWSSLIYQTGYQAGQAVINQLRKIFSYFKPTPETPFPKPSLIKQSSTTQPKITCSQQPTKQSCSAINRPALGDFEYSSASVLPFYTANHDKYFILTQEARGKNRGTWDDFGGKRDEGELHPVVTAAREFLEEANLDAILGLTSRQVIDYIDVKSNNTSFIIANTTYKGAKSVTYITDMTQNGDANTLLTGFYSALAKQTRHERKEKSQIGVIKWEDLASAITSAHDSSQTFATVQVIDKETNHADSQKVRLRPYLVARLKKFFLNQRYTVGKNNKIRFYN